MEEIGVCCSRSECKQQFDVSSHAPMTGRCDHSLCRKCTWHPPQAEIVPCPMCKEDAAEFEYFYVSVKDVAPNYQMIEMMKNMDAVIEKKKQAKEDSMYREYLATKNLVKCFVCESIVEEKQAKVCRKCHLPSRKFKDSPGCLSVSRPENLDEVKQYLICDSCLLDGPHMNCTERVLPWLPVKLRSEAWMVTKSLRKEAELSRYGVKEQSSNLCMSLNGITRTIRSFRSDAEHSVGKQYLKLPEKFEKIKKESEILQKFEGIFHEQVEEHLSDIEALKRRMLNILDPDAEPDFPARETPMSKQTLSKGLDFLRSFGIRYDPDADADCTVSPQTHTKLQFPVEKYFSWWEVRGTIREILIPVMSCPECKKDFDNAARSPILGKCVHSVCAACAFNPVSGISIDCPICQEEYAFMDRIGNYQMIEILGNMDDAIRAKKEVRKEQKLEEYLESKNLLKCFDCGCIVEIEQGRVCITCYGPTINYGVSQGYMYITDPVNLEEVKRRVLCAGCFFEGRHRECEGFANLPWLQVKYSSEISLQSTALEKVAKESRKRMKEDIVRLTGSLKEVDMLYLKLVAKLQNATGDAVFQLEDLVEKFRKETEVLKKIESDFAEQALEHAANLNDVTRTMKKIINPNPVEEYDEFPKDRKQLNRSIPERRFYKSEYEDSDSESTKYW